MGHSFGCYWLVVCSPFGKQLRNSGVLGFENMVRHCMHDLNQVATHQNQSNFDAAKIKSVLS